MPFGWGDGGGGPTREMLAAAARTRSLEGSPTVRITTPAGFFAAAEEEYLQPPVWSGELYLEFHRGTYTSQARTKRGNRRIEHLLREAELWATTVAVRNGFPYPYDLLEACWRTVLLQQFHDILPGTSIALVHRQAERDYARVAAELEDVVDTALRALVGDGPLDLHANAGPLPVDGTPALSVAAAGPPAPLPPVEEKDDGVVLDNGAVRVVVDGRGLLTSIHDVVAERELLAPDEPANLLQLFRDTPTRWDAWDVDARDRRIGRDLVETVALTVEPGPAVRVVRSTGP